MYFVTWVYWVYTLFANSGKFHHFPSSSRLPENHCARFEGAAITCQRPGSWSDRSAVVPMKWAFRWVNYWNLSRWMDGWMDRSTWYDKMSQVKQRHGTVWNLEFHNFRGEKHLDVKCLWANLGPQKTLLHMRNMTLQKATSAFAE
jgi:hypothetical protein